MKKLKKIKLSNIKDSQFEKEELVQLRGGYNPCYPCEGCVGAGSAVNHSVAHYKGEE